MLDGRIRDWPAFFSEMQRIIRPGGHIEVSSLRRYAGETSLIWKAAIGILHANSDRPIIEGWEVMKLLKDAKFSFIRHTGPKPIRFTENYTLPYKTDTIQDVEIVYRQFFPHEHDLLRTFTMTLALAEEDAGLVLLVYDPIYETSLTYEKQRNDLGKA